MHFGEILQRLRKEKGLSQADLANASGVSVGTIQGWEIGRRCPVSMDLFRITEVLRVSADEFAGMTAERKPVRRTKRKGAGK